MEKTIPNSRWILLIPLSSIVLHTSAAANIPDGHDVSSLYAVDTAAYKWRVLFQKKLVGFPLWTNGKRELRRARPRKLERNGLPR